MYQIPKARRRKLDYKAAEGIFVGYETTTKHYKVYDPSSSRLITVRNVVLYEDVGYWKKRQPQAGGTSSPVMDGSLDIRESLPFMTRDDSEEEEGGQCNEENYSDGDGGEDINPPVTPVVMEERVKRRKKGGRTVGVREMEGLVFDWGKAWERRSEEPSRLEESESREVVTDFVGIVEAGPSSVQEAMESKEKSEWKAAIGEEISNRECLKTWTVVDRVSDGPKLITSRLVLQCKLNPDRGHDWYKA